MRVAVLAQPVNNAIANATLYHPEFFNCNPRKQ